MTQEAIQNSGVTPDIAEGTGLEDSWRERKIQVAKFLEQYGLTIRDADAAAAFFCNSRWDVETLGSIGDVQGTPQVIFTEQDFKGVMGRRVTFAFMGVLGQKRLHAAVDWFGRKQGFDFQEFMWRSLAGNPEIDSVSRVKLVKGALVISGRRFVNFSSDKIPAYSVSDLPTKDKAGSNLQVIKINPSGGVSIRVDNRSYVLSVKEEL